MVKKVNKEKFGGKEIHPRSRKARQLSKHMAGVSKRDAAVIIRNKKYKAKTDKFKWFQNKIVSELELKKPSDHLANTFFTTEIGDPFHKSGYCPHNLVANYIWITK